MAVTEAECDAVVHDFEFEDCVWGDRYVLEIVDGACEFTAAVGEGECVSVYVSDSDGCDESNACGPGPLLRSVFTRPGEADATDVVRIPGECYGGHPGPEWTQCVVPVDADTDTDATGSGSGDATSGGLSDPTACDCACGLAFPG